jgi:methylmalonyl-CoA mutase N-terminal domain/subunit
MSRYRRRVSRPDEHDQTRPPTSDAPEPQGGRRAWQEAYDATAGTTSRPSNDSGLARKPIYGPADVRVADADTEPDERIGWPGAYPYTRGPYASMYHSKIWTMRQFAGFGTALDTNERFHTMLRNGGHGLSTAFDLPTLMGRDSDDPMSDGEVGRCGVAVDTLADMIDLFHGIDLGAVSTSMTINSPAAILLAMYVAVADRHGTDRRALGGTLQNDILKEYQAQNEFIFPPRPSMRLVRDTIAFCAAELPRWHPISISGYHIREAGSTAVQELAFTLANGFAYVELAQRAGLAVDAFAPRLSFFFNAHTDFFAEIAKYRAARRIWARWLRDRYGATDDASMRLRFHTQTAGVSLTAQQPEVNIARTAIEALAGVLGGTQSLHTNSMDEALALPTDKAVRIALRTQQVIAHETGVADVIDPLGGSWYVESLTDEMEAAAEEVFAHLDEMGGGSLLDGVLRGVDEGWFVDEIAESAYAIEQALQRGERIVVGVNAFTDGNDEEQPELLKITAEQERQQVKRLGEVKAERDSDAVAAALAEVRNVAADPEANLMPSLISASDAMATEGEIVNALAEEFGRHRQIL